MQNLDIRTLVKECGVQYQSIAKELGVTPVWMSRMMSRPLSVNNKIRILTAINKLKSESKDENEYDRPYLLRGENRQKAEELGLPVEYCRLALMAVSVFHLSHWRLDVTTTNYLIQ